MTYENPLPQRAWWIKKMLPFNFMIYYQPEVKMGHVNFTSQMETFLPKNSISKLISTLRAQKQPELLSLK